MTPAFGAWAWECAQPYRDEDRPEVERLVRAVRDAADRRDLTSYVAHFDIKSAELGRSTERSGDELVAQNRRMMERVLGDPGLTVGGAEPASLELSASAGGRLVEVAAPDGLGPGGM